MKKLAKGLKYSFTVMSHPIRGFYDIRFEGQGNILSCIFILIIFIISFVLQRQYTGFIFNTVNVKEFNIIREIFNVFVPVILWCTANWSITALIDGEGRFKDIFMATSYATVPYIITSLLTVLLSRFLTADEGMFLSIISSLGLFISAFLLFFGIMTIHQFTVGKSIFSIILTIAGMIFIIFIVTIFAGKLDDIISYVLGIIMEIRLRL